MRFILKRFDFVILNSDLSSLSDEDILSQTEAALNLLKIGSHLFYTAIFSPDSSKENMHFNLTVHVCIKLNIQESRSAITYIDLTQMKVEHENEVQYGFDLVFAKPASSNQTVI